MLILLEYGVLGFLIFYGLFLTGIWKAGRTLFDLGPTDREVSLLILLIIALSNWLIIKSIFAQADNNPLIFRSEEHTYEPQSLLLTSYPLFCLKHKYIHLSCLLHLT